MSKKLTVSNKQSKQSKQSKESSTLEDSLSPIVIRPTQHEYALLKLYADNAGMSISRYLVEMGLSSSYSCASHLRLLLERIQFELSFINHTVSTLSFLCSKRSSSPKLQQQLLDLSSSLLHSSKFLFEIFSPSLPISLCFNKLSNIPYPSSFSYSSNDVPSTATPTAPPSPNQSKSSKSDTFAASGWLATPINASYSDSFGNIIDFDHILVRKTPINNSPANNPSPLEDTFALEQEKSESTYISNLTRSIPTLIIDSEFTTSTITSFNPTTLFPSINPFVHLQTFSSDSVHLPSTYSLISPLPSIRFFSPISNDSFCKATTSVKSSISKSNYISHTSNDNTKAVATPFSFSHSYFFLQNNVSVGNDSTPSSSSATAPTTKPLPLPSSKTALINAVHHQDELDHMAENDPQAYAQYMASYYQELGEFDPSLYLDDKDDADEDYPDDKRDFDDEGDEDEYERKFLHSHVLYERKFGEPLGLGNGDENEDDQDEDDDEEDPSSIT